MDNLSKVIFTCLAISITLLVYQNTQLKDEVDTLRGFVELDTKAQWERIESLENPYKGAINVEVLERCTDAFSVIGENLYTLDDTLYTLVEAEEYCKRLATGVE